MRIGILGTGNLATGLGGAWARAGHHVVIAGRSYDKANNLAKQLGHGIEAVPLQQAVVGCDAVLLAVLWGGVQEILHSVGAFQGLLTGVPLIDPTNAVEHGVGVLLTDSSESGAVQISALAPGAHVVKAFHLFPATQWGAISSDQQPVTVAMCGDDADALDTVSQLVQDVGAVPAVLGPLARAKQLEEVAGFVIGLAFGGFDPRAAIPQVPSPVKPRSTSV